MREIVGRLWHRFATGFVIATKFGFKNGTPSAGMDSRRSGSERLPTHRSSALRLTALTSLSARVDPNVPMEEVAGTVKDLIRVGKVKHFGLSEAGAQSIRRAQRRSTR